MKNTITSFMIRTGTKGCLWFLAAASAAILGTALISQYGFGLYPCELCLYQRYPYAAIIAITALTLLFLKNTKLQSQVVLLCIALLWLDAGIAGYHAGVELNIFAGPDACSGGASSVGKSIEDIRRAIMEAPLVSCKQAMIHVLGLSMAAWNMIAALLLSAVTILWWFLLRRSHAQ